MDATTPAETSQRPGRGMRAVHPATIFPPFAAGYFLSYLFRSANGPLAGKLIHTFGLGPRDLGLLTAIFFLTFAAFQIPAGILIDRFGPRRVQTALLVVAAGGVFLFAAAQAWPMLLLARALIGLGCAGALVTGVKALSLWLPPERRALGNCCLVMCGGLGAMASTAPLDAIVAALGWRATFFVLGLATLATAAFVWTLVPKNDLPPGEVPSMRDIARGLETIARDRRFWRVAPLSAAVVGAAFAIHGLWAARWLADVSRLDQSAIAGVMLTMGAGLLIGAAGLGALAAALRRRGITTTALFITAALTFLAVQAAIVVDTAVPPTIAFGVFALFGAVTVLSFTIMGELFPSSMAGRANGALNVLHLGAAFAMQAGIGAIVALWPADTNGHAPVVAYQAAFAAIVAIQVVALGWFALSVAPARKRRAGLGWCATPAREVT